MPNVKTKSLKWEKATFAESWEASRVQGVRPMWGPSFKISYDGGHYRITEYRGYGVAMRSIIYSQYFNRLQAAKNRCGRAHKVTPN